LHADKTPQDMGEIFSRGRKKHLRGGSGGSKKEDFFFETGQPAQAPTNLCGKGGVGPITKGGVESPETQSRVGRLRRVRRKGGHHNKGKKELGWSDEGRLSRNAEGKPRRGRRKSKGLRDCAEWKPDSGT